MVDFLKYEGLQARWRSEVLALPAGPPTNPRSRRSTVGWCLPHEFAGAAAADAGWNFVSATGCDFARQRVLGAGLISEDRLWRNMLPSQPLAFGIVGEFRTHRDAAARVLGRLTGLPVIDLLPLGDVVRDSHALVGLDAEWAPPPALHTGDRSGFDIAALVRLIDGERVFVSVEVKYTDTFSPGFKGEKLAAKVVHHRPHLSALGIDAVSGTSLLGSRTNEPVPAVGDAHRFRRSSRSPW